MYPAILLTYFISASVILLGSLASIFQVGVNMSVYAREYWVVYGDESFVQAMHPLSAVRDRLFSSLYSELPSVLGGLLHPRMCHALFHTEDLRSYYCVPSNDGRMLK